MKRYRAMSVGALAAAGLLWVSQPATAHESSQTYAQAESDTGSEATAPTRPKANKAGRAARREVHRAQKGNEVVRDQRAQKKAGQTEGSSTGSEGSSAGATEGEGDAQQ
jgi:hypothetical protein